MPIEMAMEQALVWRGRGAVLLDVRDRSERERLRIPNSIWIPITELLHRWRQLPPGAAVIVYCSAGSRSYRAAKFLREQGLQASALVGGVSEWLSHGGEVEAGPPEGLRVNEHLPAGADFVRA
jgi:rhodanese-related sulfurtransferase